MLSSLAVAPMPQGTDAAAPASRRVPVALHTLIDLGAGQTVSGVDLQARAASTDYVEHSAGAKA